MNQPAFAVVDVVGFFGRWLVLGGVLLTFGAVVFRVVVVRHAAIPSTLAGPLARSAARCGVAGALSLIGGSLARLYFQTAEMRFPGDPWVPLGATLLIHSTWGYLWITQVALALIVLSLTYRAAHDERAAARWRAVSVLALVLVITPSLASHAMSGHMNRAITLSSDMVHLLGASTWLGTLTVLFVAVVRVSGVRRDARVVAALLAVFSPLALGGAAAVVASGVVSASMHLSRVQYLVQTAYGRLLLVKVVLLFGVIGLGWWNWRRMTPRLEQGEPAAVVSSIAAELALAVLILGVTAALIITPPPMKM